jgi:hypothetical protein
MTDDPQHHDDAPIEGEAVEEVSPAGGGGTALEKPAPVSTVPAMTPQATAAELGARLQVIEDAMANAMTEGVDYGKVPGTDKPALFKPGAEKLSVLFKLDVQPRSEKTWGPGEHLTVITQATVYDIATGARIGFGEGLCTTREKKYGKRKQDRVCTSCGKPTIKRSKFPPRDEPDAPPGWYCFEKVGGCGTNFDFYDEGIRNQRVGEIENPDLPDTWNTVIKMAGKRARVDAVLNVTGASAIFTQDLDEQEEVGGGDAAAVLHPATEEQRARLNAALNWLLPPTEGEAVWNAIHEHFGGALYGPVVEAVTAPIRARKQIHDDEAATEREAQEGEREEEERRQAAEENESQDPADAKQSKSKTKKGAKKS